MWPVKCDMVLIFFAMKNNDSAECDFFSAFLENNSYKETDEKISKIMKDGAVLALLSF